MDVWIFNLPLTKAPVYSYKKLAVDLKPGSQVLIADGSIVLEVVSTDPKQGTVRARCLNSATLGCASCWDLYQGGLDAM